MEDSLGFGDPPPPPPPNSQTKKVHQRVLKGPLLVITEVAKFKIMV